MPLSGSFTGIQTPSDLKRPADALMNNTQGRVCGRAVRPQRRVCPSAPVCAHQGSQPANDCHRHKAVRTNAVAAEKQTVWAPGEQSALSRAPVLNGKPGKQKTGGRPLSDSVHGVILAGGPADNPLARFRAMPAVELGANTQLIDVTISNCIRSGINKIYVLTQFNSHQLNTHITTNYPPAVFGSITRQGYVDVLAAQQTATEKDWYKGSADAVRRNLPMILEPFRGAALPDELLVLSGQALYRMDYGDLINTHRSTGADITIATHSVGWGQAQLRGLCRVDPDTGLVGDFTEKPTGKRLEEMAHASKHASSDDPFEASMGVYVFKSEVLVELLQGGRELVGRKEPPSTHFGHDVIPQALREKKKVVAHHYDGYWRDINSLRDFYEVNLELAQPGAPISIYDVDEAIVSRGHILPPSLIHDSEIENTLIGEGSVLVGSTIRGSVIGCNTYVAKGCHIENSLIMGNDNYTNDRMRAEARAMGESVLGIGENTYIKGAIVDDNASVGSNVRIENKEGVKESDRTSQGYVIQDGIPVVLKGAIIPDGFHI
jgi:glucose-1-phosphate adenylyltransferase